MKNISNIYRRKTAMVLHDIEMSLGKLIAEQEVDLSNIPENLVEDIRQRESKRGRIAALRSISDVIEATYLDEIFSVLLETNKDTSLHPYIIELKNLFVLYNVYEIRNVISHPNRSFKIPYWYNVAAIASDSVIEILGLTDVQSSLFSAEEGIISDPPDEWLENNFWRISNNLPSLLDHSITGLVGRKKESTEVLEVLKNPRINTIAVVAPGGMGKTALVLDILDKVVKDSSNNSWCDLCLFITLKNEFLTSTGVERKEALKTIDEIKNQITEEVNKISDDCLLNFDAVKAFLKEKKVILFIDNLETLLVDSSSEFQLFNESLPVNWRMLITSRITVGFARVVSLENLQPKMASTLARLYNSRKGGINLGEDKLSKIVENCHYNPLAIRLTLDLVNLGNDIPESLNIVSKEIAKFSYKNLIETLSITSVKILESLFLEAADNRNDLCELLDLSKESISEGIAELSNTSLIYREYSADNEILSLSESIIDFLTTNNRNIEVREEIHGEVKIRKARVQEIDKNQRDKRVPYYRWDYLPTTSNENLKLILTMYIKELHGVYLSTYKASKLAVKFKEAEEFYQNDSFFNLAHGKILESVSALSPAIIRYDLAIKIDPNNFSAYFFKAIALHKLSEYDDAQILFDKLYDDGYGNIQEIDKSFLIEFMNMRYMNMLYNHKYELIIAETKNWKQGEYVRGLYGAFRANAIKRFSETINLNDVDAKIEQLGRIISIFSDVFKNEELTKKVSLLSKSIFNEIGHYLCIDDYKKKSAFANESLIFIQNYFIDTTPYVKYKEDDHIVRLLKSLARNPSIKNPFNKIVWQRFLSQFESISDDKVEDLIVSESYILTTVVRCPKNESGNAKGFVFSVCSDGEKYFIHLSRVENINESEWLNVKVGMKMEVKVSPVANRKSEKSIPVETARIIY